MDQIYEDSVTAARTKELSDNTFATAFGETTPQADEAAGYAAITSSELVLYEGPTAEQDPPMSKQSYLQSLAGQIAGSDLDRLLLAVS